MEIEEHSNERDHMSIDIVNEDVLLSSIKEKMESISLSYSVCRVPEKFFKINEAKYFPSLVSIGPFHHGQDNLKDMEDQKWRYLNALLSRKANAAATLDRCIKALRQVEPKARKFYGETIEMCSDQFVEMMLLDGCFIIELFLEDEFTSLRRRDDPCFSTNEGLSRLKCDLILFGNQLPFFILDQLFRLVPIPKLCHLSLVELALFFFKKLFFIPGTQFPREFFGPQTHHLLDLIRQHYLPTSPQDVPRDVPKDVPQDVLPSSDGKIHMPQACRLSSFGISVENFISKSPSNIKFSNGELKIPSLEIHDYTEILFRNLIAMEHCQPRCSKHVTSYVFLMERLIRSERDVRLLQDKEILIDCRERKGEIAIDGRERKKEIVFLFQRLHVDINVKDFYYRGLCEQVSRHQKRRKQVCLRNIKRIYHRTRLGMAGFSLAIFFLVFLFTGAFFTAVSFLLHHFQ